IDADMWKAYRRRRSQRASAPVATQARSTLAGMIKCDDCGGPMRQHWRANGAKSVPGYACSNALRFKDGRRLVTCRQESVHAAVREWVDGLASDLDAFARIEQQIERRKIAAIHDADGIARRITKTKGTLGALTVKWVEGKLTEDAYQAAAGRLNAELERLAAMDVAADPSPSAELNVRSLAIRVSEIWDDATADELRALLSQMIAEVRVIPPVAPRAGGRVTYRIIPKWEDG
ncbi:zinc ribbon domain-containing protein, partial [Kitasatospora herbaricolor]|uniref:zinc ribbon domain-containing protein n=1 Tax=Kitasatospora herbaricolor TaxID=68217 RepID=UPI0036D8D781